MKKVLSVLLALVLMLTSLSVIAFADDGKNTSYPRIYVHGFMSRDILADKNDKDSDVLWPPAADTILDAVKKALPSLAKFAVTRDWQTLGNEITPLAKDIFAPAFLDENGNAKGDSGVYFVYPKASTIKKDSELSFSYDWRLDPVELAAQLNDFIEYVLKCSGADKVDLQCHSFGGIVTSTYAKIYGVDKLHTVVFNSTAVFGETYTGELMTGKLNLDKDAIVNFMSYVFDNNEYEHLLNAMIKLFSDAGLLDFICSFGNDLIAELSEQVLPEVIVPAFGGWLSVWAMVPNADIDEGMNYVFNEIYKNSDIDRSGLISKINNFNALFRPFKADVLNEINDNTNFYVISKYGYCSIPITPSWTSMTDGVVDTRYTSFGATCSDFDSELSAEYLAGKNPEMISPNKKVDSSTCMFPDRTWFIRDANHSLGIDDISNVFFAYDGQATVDTFEDLPRFLIYDGPSDSFVPDEGQTDDTSFLATVKAIITELRALLKMIIELIFGKLAPVC